MNDKLYAVNPGLGASNYIEDLKQKGFSTLLDAINYYQRHGWRLIDTKNDYARMGLYLDHTNDPAFSWIDKDVPDVDIVIGKDTAALWYPF